MDETVFYDEADHLSYLEEVSSSLISFRRGVSSK